MKIITRMKYLLTATVFLFVVHLSVCKTCLKNEDIGFNEGNTYECNEPDLTECCEVKTVFTCCEESSIVSARDQFIIWGVVGGVVLVIIIAVLYFGKDFLLCEKNTIQESFRSVLKKKKIKKIDEKKMFNLSDKPKSAGKSRTLKGRKISNIDESVEKETSSEKSGNGPSIKDLYMSDNKDYMNEYIEMDQMELVKDRA